MSRSTRLSLAALLLALLCAFLFTITRPDDGTPVERPEVGGAAAGGDGPTAQVFTSSTQCESCHPGVYAEWQGSHHQIAYENPEVRRLSDDFRNKECQACHLPRPIAETGLLNRTLPRRTRPSEGVGCLTCHLDTNGRVLGQNASDKGCRPIASPDFMSVKSCETCHNQHKTTDQWRASPYPAQGIDCSSCHMPSVPREDGRSGRMHVFHGCHDLATLQSAATFEARREGDEIVVETTNSGAGHNFPTEERHRAVDVEVRFVGAEPALDENGEPKPEWERLMRFRQPYRDEPGENTQLPAGETHVARAPIPAGATSAEVRLWYRLNPYAEDDDPASTLLYERTVDLQ